MSAMTRRLRVSQAQHKREIEVVRHAEMLRDLTAVNLASWLDTHGYVHPDDPPRFRAAQAALDEAVATLRAGYEEQENE